ncbi:MAG: DUF1244 domain-containing protein [Pseudomonadales bacterium]
MDQLELESKAAAFDRLLEHLRQNTDVQNIDLMILADFCRNCLSRWYMEAANERGIEINYEQSRELIYGMPYDEWKKSYQKPATPEQIAALEARNTAGTSD